MLSAMNKQAASKGAAPATESTAPAPASAPAAPAAPAAASAAYVPTAADFQNTAWSVPTPMGQVTINLQPGGAVTAQVPGMGNVQGNWSVSGNTLRAQAMGQSIVCQIQGGQVLYNGQPLQRVR
jgi:hypothetical protein